MVYKTITINEEREATLSSYILPFEDSLKNTKKKRPAILIIPGGGYTFCSERATDQIAFSYSAKGFQSFVLRYSVNDNKSWPNPLEDYEMAMEYIITHAKEFGIYEDKIAVVGFSAGGHLAGAAATIAKHKPNAAILVYAVLNDAVKLINQEAPNIIEHIDENTPPLFFVHSRTDSLVSVMNTIKAMEKAAQYDIAFESHIYSFGSHGFSSSDDSIVNDERSSRTKNWIDDSIEWLRELFGTFSSNGLTERRCPLHITDNYKSSFSVNCTISYLFEREETKDYITSLINDSKEYDMKEVIEAVGDMTLSVVLTCFGKKTKEQILNINSQLTKIIKK